MLFDDTIDTPDITAFNISLYGANLDTPEFAFAPTLSRGGDAGYAGGVELVSINAPVKPASYTFGVLTLNPSIPGAQIFLEGGLRQHPER